jgi:hypothetical protein
MATRPPLLRFDASTLPPLETSLFGELAPPKQIADDAELLTAYLEARETLTADVRRFWGGIARRVEHDSADPAALADLAEKVNLSEQAARVAETRRDSANRTRSPSAPAAFPSICPRAASPTPPTAGSVPGPSSRPTTVRPWGPSATSSSPTSRNTGS